MAVIKFKQGFGRLIRSRDDRGVVIIFDRRLVTKKYGHLFLQSLPDARCIKDKQEVVLGNETVFCLRNHRLHGFLSGIFNPIFSKGI